MLRGHPPANFLEIIQTYSNYPWVLHLLTAVLRLVMNILHGIAMCCMIWRDHKLLSVEYGLHNCVRYLQFTTFLPISITRIEQQHLLCTLVSISLEVHLFQVAWSVWSFPTCRTRLVWGLCDINVASMHKSDGVSAMKESESQ